MKEIHDSKCPLCEAIATFEFRDRRNIRFFHCEVCGDFFISRSAINWLNKKEPHRKAHFARLSASLKSKDDILQLTIVAGEGLHAQQVPRTKYPE
jgi:Zn-finger nucleic acid-binding protein